VRLARLFRALLAAFTRVSHSARNALSGSILAAVRAGTMLAIIATIATPTAANQ